MPKLGEPVAPSAITDERSLMQTLKSFVTQTFAVAAAEVQKLRHDPLELFTRAVQPVLWLMLFGEVMARVRGVTRPRSDRTMQSLAFKRARRIICGLEPR